MHRHHRQVAELLNFTIFSRAPSTLAPMPPRIASVARLSTALRSRSKADLFFCPSCSLWRLADAPTTAAPRPLHAPRFFSATRRRNASTLASRTAINAPLDVPPRLKELHQALDALKSDAASYVNLSRLQLALRGLESEDPVVRVAGAYNLGENTWRDVLTEFAADSLEYGRPGVGETPCQTFARRPARREERLGRSA